MMGSLECRIYHNKILCFWRELIFLLGRGFPISRFFVSYHSFFCFLIYMVKFEQIENTLLAIVYLLGRRFPIPRFFFSFLQSFFLFLDWHGQIWTSWEYTSCHVSHQQLVWSFYFWRLVSILIVWSFYFWRLVSILEWSCWFPQVVAIIFSCVIVVLRVSLQGDVQNSHGPALIHIYYKTKWKNQYNKEQTRKYISENEVLQLNSNSINEWKLEKAIKCRVT